jgi:hypothetical protein
MKAAKPDRSKIMMHEPREAKYWCRHLDVTPRELQLLIEKVGNSAATVPKEIEIIRSVPGIDPGRP